MKIEKSTAWVVLFAATLAMAGEDYAIAPAKGVIAIDGRLDDAAWKDAVWASGFSLLKSKNPNKASPSAETRFAVLTDADNLYIAVRALEPDMARLAAGIKGAHTNPWSDDTLEFFLAPTGMEDEYYQFVVAAGGGWWQMYYAEGGNIKPDPFAPLWDVATGREAGAWTAELRIPWRSFYMTGHGFWKDAWQFNIARSRKRDGQLSSWSPLDRSFNEIKSFNRVTGIPPKKPADDIFLKNATARIASKNKNGVIAGSLAVEVEADPAAAGAYALSIESPDLARTPAPLAVTLTGGANSLAFPDVAFTKEGRISVTLALARADGGTAAARVYPVAVLHRPLALHFEAPGYAKCFFPGQDAGRLTGAAEVRLPVAEAVLEAAGKTLTLEVKDGRAAFDLDIAGAAADRIEVTLRAGDESLTEVVRKLPPVETPMAWIEKPGRIILNGKPAFGLGWYGPAWIVSRRWLEKYPTPAAKQPEINIHGWITLEPFRLVKGIEAREATRDVEPCREMFDKVRETIASNRGKKDFWIWYLSDEPECRGLSPVYLGHLYRYVKELDPYRPVMIVTREPERFVDCADILNPHPYIGPISIKGERVLRRPVETVGSMFKSFGALGRRDKALMFTPQACSLGSLYPTFDETNASVWIAVCGGIQGLTPYIYYDHASRPGLNLGFDWLYQSLSRLAPLIAAPRPPAPLTVSNPKIGARLNRGPDDGLLLVIANPTPEAQRTVVTADALKDAPPLFRFRGAGEVIPENGSLAAELAPYGVWVLTSARMDEGLSTEAELRAAIDLAEAERTGRGNILFGKRYDVEVSASSDRYVLQNQNEQKEKMFDGVLDVCAWKPSPNQGELWYEVAFPKYAVKFSKARIHGHALAGTTFSVKKAGEWRQPEAKATEGDHFLEFDFGQPLSTINIRLDFTTPRARDDMVELYEIELLP